MISTTENNIGAGLPARSLKITSPEALDAAIGRVVTLKIKYTAARAEIDQEIAAMEKRHQARLTALTDSIAAEESEVRDYCEAHRSELFTEKKSRSTLLADFGFETTPPRVETTSRKIKWKDVIARLLKLSWGKAYLRAASYKVDKESLLSDRDKLTPEQLTAAGIQFCQDEQFFIRPKLETAASTSAETK